MNQHEFDSGMRKLKEQWPNAYSSPRIGLIWSEFKDITGAVWENMVNTFIGEFKAAPLLQDMRDILAKQRERIIAAQKIQYSNEAHNFWNPPFHDDEIRWLVETIKSRLNGNIQDNEYEEFKKLIKEKRRLENEIT